MAKVGGGRSAPLWAQIGVGLASGLIIPVPIIVILDTALLILGLWYVFSGVSQLGAPSGQSVWTVLGMMLAVNLLNLLRHLWGIRWVLLVSGGLGVLAAVAQRAASRIPREWGRGLSFLAILAVLSLSFNGVFLLWREKQAELVAVDRAIYFLRQLGEESYEVNLIAGTAAALVLALLFWEAWRTLYKGLGARVGLAQPRRFPLPPQPSISEPTVGEYTAHLAALRREALVGARVERAEARASSAQEAQAVQGMALEAGAEFDHRGTTWVGGLLLLCVVAWLPLDWAYGRHVPRTISGSVYLHPGAAERLERVRIGASPHEIVFASSVGHGLFDADLVRRPGASAPIREVRDFELRETSDGAYSYAHMSIEGLEPGEYYLRMSLRPAGELSPGAFAVMGDGEGVVDTSLYQGGGITYRLIAVGMATVLTVGLLGMVSLLIRGVVYLRAR